jgi:hypothetical protein
MLHQKRLKTAKRWAKIWKRETSGNNGQASLSLMWTHTLPRVTSQMPENGQAMGENVETGDIRQKRASVT